MRRARAGEQCGRRRVATPTLALADAQLVGAWGLGVTWDDGHATGIYPFAALHEWIVAGHPVFTPDSGLGN